MSGSVNARKPCNGYYVMQEVAALCGHMRIPEIPWSIRKLFLDAALQFPNYTLLLLLCASVVQSVDLAANWWDC